MCTIGGGCATEKTAAAAAAEKLKKKKEVVRESECYINALLKNPPRLPSFLNPEHLQLDDDAELQGLAAILKVCYDKNMAILQQYHDKGYALMEVDVEDDDEKNN